MADETVTTVTDTTTQQQTPPAAAPAQSTIADLAAKGDVRGFMQAREAQLRGETPKIDATAVVETPAAQEKPATTEEQKPEPTAEEAAEQQRASEAGKALAETKSRRERRRQSIQDEIDDLTRKRAEARREAEAEQARLEAIRNEQLALAAKPKADAPAPDDPEPTPEQFDTYEKYVRAAGRWEARQEAKRLQAEIDKKLQEDRTARDTAAQSRAQQDAAAAHAARMAATRAAHADFDSVIAANVDLRVPQVLFEAIPYSPVGGEVMYHLAKHPDVADALMDLPISAPMRDAIMDSTATLAPKLLSYLVEHPDECQRIASTPDPRAQHRAMGRLEARLDVASSGPTPAAKPVTSAPPPIKPVGSSATATTVSTQDLAVQGRGREFMERRDREERERKYRLRA